MDKEIEILYEDNDLIVCHKPAGVPVQSARIGQKDMVSILTGHLAEALMERKTHPRGDGRKQTDRREIPQIYVIHRLDQPVEGVIVFAKTKRAAAGLSRQAADGTMKKFYLAVCCAVDEKKYQAVCSEADWKKDQIYDLSDYLVRDGRTNTSSVVSREIRDAKRAELSFRILGRKVLRADRPSDEDADNINGADRADDAIRKDVKREYLLVRIELKTGRHHQIRVQMAHAGLPLYGDRKYNERWVAEHGVNRNDDPLALCAVSLAFIHPVLKKEMRFETAPCSDIFSFFSGGMEAGR